MLADHPPKPKPYPFAPIDARINKRYGDQELCKRLKCAWFRLDLYRRDGIDEYQADRIANRLFGVDPYQLWPNYGFEDDMDMDLEDDLEDWE